MNFQALRSRDSNVLIVSAVKYKFLLEQGETSRAKHQQPQNLLNKFVMSLLLIENRLLLQLQQKQSFHDAVTEKFIAQNEELNCATDKLLVLFCNLQHKSASCVLIIATILKMSTH